MGKKNNVSIKNKNIDKITNQVGVAKNCNIGENIYNNILIYIRHIINITKNYQSHGLSPTIALANQMLGGREP